MAALKSEILPFAFEEYYSNNYGRALFNAELKMGICEATAPYIPINEFMLLFKHNSSMVEEKSLKYFLFDKRSLRAFHQPSMEWYYIVWKQEMFRLGLKDHYKILPNEPWFIRCVEAGKAQILDDYPNNVIGKISIEYSESIREVIDRIQQKESVSI